MDTLIKLVADLIKVPLSNWYKGLSETTKFIVNEIVVVVVSCCSFFFILSYSLDKFDERKSERHTEGTIQRIDVQSDIMNNLRWLITQTECKRAFVIEMHNGVNNPSGLPYLYGEMTYEETNDSIPYIADMYQKITLSTYKIGVFVHQKYEWFGTLEEVMHQDKKLYNILKNNNVTHFGVITLSKHKCDVGFLIVTFTDKTISDERKKHIIGCLSKYGNYIANDLTLVQ